MVVGASTALYVVLVLAVAVQRLTEVRLSRRQEAALKARGGVEHAREQVRVMVVLHASWLVASIAEVVALDRPFNPTVAGVALVALLLGQALRYAGRRALGDRWTVTVVTVADAPLVATGLYRYLSHPIYLGVALEIAALPMVHSAWLTAIVFSAANGVVLVWRIRAEERALGLSP
jgi:methyltransferase